MVAGGLSAANTTGTNHVIDRPPPTGSHIYLRSLRERHALCPRIPEGAAARRPPATFCGPSGSVAPDKIAANRCHRIPQGSQTVAGGLSVANTTGTNRVIESPPPTGSHIHLRSLRERCALEPRIPEGAAARRPPATFCGPFGSVVPDKIAARRCHRIPTGSQTVAGGLSEYHRYKSRYRSPAPDGVVQRPAIPSGALRRTKSQRVDATESRRDRRW
ncbi:hypothetical protein Mal33_01670 [Rosistilla oblonga]|uniref:Uncharacterized protein n=1 Tax=Rosistilla oblonga TaxID=2527990 RepID=A0A518IM97_9BACT|nr:hypothetical protein Mal33_01670 [Rosistilla oblonga]